MNRANLSNLHELEKIKIKLDLSSDVLRTAIAYRLFLRIPSHLTNTNTSEVSAADIIRIKTMSLRSSTFIN